MHTFQHTMSTIPQTSNEISRPNQYDTVYYQVYKQIDYIKKFKITSELNNKEKDEQLKEYKKLLDAFTENEVKLKVEIERLKSSLEKSESFKIEATHRIEFMFNAIKILNEQMKDMEKQKMIVDETNEICNKQNEITSKKMQEMEQKLEFVCTQSAQEIELVKSQSEAGRRMFNQELESYQNQLQKLKEENQAQLVEIKNQNNLLAEFALDIAAKKELIDFYDKQQEELNKSIDEKVLIIESLNKKESEMTKRFEEKNKLIEEMKQNLDEKFSNELKLTESLTTSEKMVSELNESIDKLKTELNSKFTEIQLLEQKFETDLIESEKRKNEEFEIQNSANLSKIADLESQIEVLTSQNSDLENFKKISENDKIKLEEDFKLKLEDHKAQISSLEKNLFDKNDEILKLEISLQKLQIDQQNLNQKLETELNMNRDFRARTEQYESILVQKENLLKDLNGQIKILIEEKLGLINQMNQFKSMIKLKNDDIENWISKFYEVEKKLENAETKFAKRGIKRFKSTDSYGLNEVVSSVESDLKIVDDEIESLRTQSIPTYQVPKKKNVKIDDYECLENVDDHYFLRSYKQSLKESVETYRKKRRSRQNPESILKVDPINTSTPGETFVNLSLTVKKANNDISSSLESF